MGDAMKGRGTSCERLRRAVRRLRELCCLTPHTGARPAPLQDFTSGQQPAPLWSLPAGTRPATPLIGASGQLPHPVSTSGQREQM